MRRSLARNTLRLAAALLTGLPVACGDSQMTDPPGPHPEFGKGASGPTVTSTDPSYGDQGTSGLVVHVLGSGFDQNSRAIWALSGDTSFATTHIRTNSTTFVSSSELVANIDIGADAQLAFYDVAVVTASGRKGIGTELFEVTTAISLGFGGLGRGMNDLGDVVGYTDGGSYFWDSATRQRAVLPSIRMPSEAAGTAWDVDQAGVTVAGADPGADVARPVIWTRSGRGSTSWTRTQLPDLSAGGSANAVVSGADGTARLIGGVMRLQIDRKTRVQLPAVWRGAGTTWTGDTLRRGSYQSGLVRDVAVDASAVEIAIGDAFNGSVNRAVVWYGLTSTPVELPAPSGANDRANAISPSGTLIVGGVSGRAALWYRDAAGWQGPVYLEDTCSVAKNYSLAYDVNDAGVAVGNDCSGAAEWKTTGGALTRRIHLDGLGPGHPSEWSEAVNATDEAGGRAGDAVIWVPQ